MATIKKKIWPEYFELVKYGEYTGRKIVRRLKALML